MKIALVHDYLREYGGAERVLEALHQQFPEAPVYVAFFDRKALGIHAAKFNGWDIRQTWLARIPLITRMFSPLRMLAPRAFASLNLSGFDIVISSSNAYFAKAVRAPGGKHICYCHTPARSLYGYSTMTDWQSNPLTRWAGMALNHYLRMVDFEVAQNVDLFIANSQETRRRITKFYRRESTVVYPPVRLPASVDIPARKRALEDGYYLYVNRLAFAKHPELAVQACTQANLPLKVVGEGKLRQKLEALAGSTVTFTGAVSDTELAALYAGAKALLYPVEDEDFGMVPVEAMGYGVPVIAHRSGGPQESVIDGKTGVLFDELSVEGLLKALHRAEETRFSSAVIHRHAQQFSESAFEEGIAAAIESAVGQRLTRAATAS